MVRKTASGVEGLGLARAAGVYCHLYFITVVSSMLYVVSSLYLESINFVFFFFVTNTCIGAEG